MGTAGGLPLAWSSGYHLGSPKLRPHPPGPSASLTHLLSLLWGLRSLSFVLQGLFLEVP